jgi:hypothetical protein
MKNELVEFWIEDGILYNKFLSEFDLTKENAEKIISARNKISNNEKQYWCFDFRKVKSMPKDGRDHTDKYGQDFLHASAAIVANSIEAFIVNFFIKLKRPKVPFKAFSAKEDAIKWLNELRKQNGHL